MLFVPSRYERTTRAKPTRANVTQGRTAMRPATPATAVPDRTFVATDTAGGILTRELSSERSRCGHGERLFGNSPSVSGSETLRRLVAPGISAGVRIVYGHLRWRQA